MTEPLAIRINRPYADIDAFIAAESWTVDTRYVVLIDQDEIPKNTLVRFEIVLENGVKAIRAEARVSGPIAATEERPAGLRVRLKRIGAATKKVIDRAVEYKKAQQAEISTTASDQPAEKKGESRKKRKRRTSRPKLKAQKKTTKSTKSKTDKAESPPPAKAEDKKAEAAKAVPSDSQARADLAALRSRDPKTVAPPENRDELLERLRSRMS